MEKRSIKILVLGLVISLLLGAGVGAGVYFYTENISDVSPQGTLEEKGEMDGYDYEKFWIQNPTSGANLLATIRFPKLETGEKAPFILFVPGGTAPGNDLDQDPMGVQLLEKGYGVAYFDSDGRGQSEGEENYNGTLGQDGMHAVLVYLTSREEVDAERIGIVSFSYGITLASGMLARYADDPKVAFYIDWEGPSAREYTNMGCRSKENDTEGIAWKNCDDNEWWLEREAVDFLDKITVPYLRIQSEVDHVQRSNEHAITAINAATNGVSPWTRVNGSENPINITYTMGNPPQWLPDRSGKSHVVEYVEEMGEMFF
jgi:dipeptidyl aminopeptidase/acylaminoacyl peptidase